MPRKFSEERTRKEMIDPSTGSGHRPQLEHAGWYLRDKLKVVIGRQFKSCIIRFNYNFNQICFLRTAQSVPLQKCHHEAADLHDAPALVGFGQDAVERWFTENEVKEVVQFANKLAVK